MYCCILYIEYSLFSLQVACTHTHIHNDWIVLKLCVRVSPFLLLLLLLHFKILKKLQKKISPSLFSRSSPGGGGGASLSCRVVSIYVREGGRVRGRDDTHIVGIETGGAANGKKGHSSESLPSSGRNRDFVSSGFIMSSSSSSSFSIFFHFDHLPALAVPARTFFF